MRYDYATNPSWMSNNSKSEIPNNSHWDEAQRKAEEDERIAVHNEYCARENVSEIYVLTGVGHIVLETGVWVAWRGKLIPANAWHPESYRRELPGETEDERMAQALKYFKDGWNEVPKNPQFKRIK
jgi:hypothetical protein